MLKSIRYKLIVLYFLLVFIAMIIVGVFITDQFEKYHLDLVREQITIISNNVVRDIVQDIDLRENQQEIQQNLTRRTIPSGYEISVIEGGSYDIIASTNTEFVERKSFEVLEKSVILSSLSNRITELDTESSDNNNYRVKHMAFSFMENDENEVDYIIYARASLDTIYRTLSKSTLILIQGTVIALFITIILGYFISGSITVPINTLTVKALKMAKGDFSQRVHVKSDDEIGQLGSMFNYLTEKLDSTLLEISSEKSKLDAILNHMADGLVAIDRSGKIIHHNPSFVKMLGISERDIQGKSYDRVIRAFSKELEFSSIIQKTSSDSDKNVIFETRDKKILNASLALFRDDLGRTSGAIVVFQDITESQKLDNMRREFVANVSHELKTPITTIKSYTETLLDGALEDSSLARNFLEVIEKESDRMSSLVKDLLQLSHIDYKKVNWDFRPLDLKDLVEDSISKMDMYFKEKKQNLDLNLPPNEVRVVADRVKFEQVLINLISNAIKYTQPRGNIKISVDTVDNFALVKIADSGIGIPQEDVSRVFERFYRVDKGRSRVQGGTGLGLSIAKNIIEEHGGDITVKSELGKGSEFMISIPVDNSVDML